MRLKILSCAIIGVVLVSRGVISYALEEKAKSGQKIGLNNNPEQRSGDVKKRDPRKIVVTATRAKKNLFDVPNTTHVLTRSESVDRKQARTLPESLKEIPGVMVQKTSHGQGSPIIRGFTGFRTLFLIDGIRLNNSVFRDGPNQYWNTVDPFSIQRLEIVKGPSSVLYGSDAVGGTINALTNTRLDFGKGFLWDRTVQYRFAGAENAHIGRAEMCASYEKKLGVTVGASLKDFGDLRAGREVGLQEKTGYEEWDGDIKLEYFFDHNSKLTFLHQRVSQDDAWRTHKTLFGKSWKGTDIGNEKERSLEQRRHLTYLQFQKENMASFISGLKVSLSYHYQEEGQFRVKKDDTFDRQGFDVGTIGALLQFESNSRVGKWTYGIEYYRDQVDSFTRRYNTDGSLKKIEIQGPVADDSYYDLLGAFLQNEIPVRDVFEFISGVRYNYAAVDAGKLIDPISGEQTSYSDSWGSIVGSVRLVWHIDKNARWNMFSSISQGFRAPNLSDTTRLDTARSNELETASLGLEPEQYISYELGFKCEYEKVSSYIAFYYTDINNMIVRTPTGVMIDGDYEVTKKNSGDGYTRGIELGIDYRFHRQFALFGVFTFIDGEVDTYPSSAPKSVREPIDRLMPPTGTIGLRWTHLKRNHWIEILCTIAAKQARLSSRDEQDTQRIPPGGTPGYKVLSIRSQWELKKDMHLSIGIENILNEDYRVHGSGQNEPGTNFILGLKIKF